MESCWADVKQPPSFMPLLSTGVKDHWRNKSRLCLFEAQSLPERTETRHLAEMVLLHHNKIIAQDFAVHRNCCQKDYRFATKVLPNSIAVDCREFIEGGGEPCLPGVPTEKKRKRRSKAVKEKEGASVPISSRPCPPPPSSVRSRSWSRLVLQEKSSSLLATEPPDWRKEATARHCRTLAAQPIER